MITKRWKIILRTTLQLSVVTVWNYLFGNSVQHQQGKEIVIPPEEAFPISPQYNYCELRQVRRSDRIYMTVRPKGRLLKSIVHVLETEDMSHVQQLVLADGFSPSWDDLGLLKFEHFIDNESNNYFFSR